MLSEASRVFRMVMILPFALLASTCGGGGGSSACGDVVSKVEGCGLLPKDAKFECTEPPKDSTDCYLGCFLKASCIEIKTLYCDHVSTGTYKECAEQCVLFTCKKGGTIDTRFVCDGNADCSDGSDEAGCPSRTFTCKKGNTVGSYAHCDGHSDCEDGSDEAGCPTFTCKNGEKVPAQYRCDGKGACDDDSDELDCPPTIDEVIVCH